MSRVFDTVPPTVVDSSNFGGRSPVFGLFLGYGWVASSPGLYLGGEIFGQIENVDAKRQDFINLVGIGLTTTLKSNNTLGAVAKIGYVCKEALFFAKFGVTTTKWKFNFANTPNAAGGIGAQSVSTNSRKTGFVMGLGMDYAIAKNWAIGAEFLYTIYGSIKSSVPVNDQAVAASFTYKPKVATTNLRLKYTF